MPHFLLKVLGSANESNTDPNNPSQAELKTLQKPGELAHNCDLYSKVYLLQKFPPLERHYLE